MKAYRPVFQAADEYTIRKKFVLVNDPLPAGWCETKERALELREAKKVAAMEKEKKKAMADREKAEVEEAARKKMEDMALEKARKKFEEERAKREAKPEDATPEEAA